MKPRNKFEKAVLAESKHLRPITKTQSKWAFRECIDHFAYRLPKGRTTCMDCGHRWAMEKPTDTCTCPHCGARLQVRETFERNYAGEQKQSFQGIDPDRVKWEQFEQMGVSRESLEKGKHLDDLLQYRKTPLIPISIKIGEISLYTDLCGFTFFQAFVHLFIEQMPCTGNPNDLIQGTQFNKIR